MENATKALIIAGAILVSILLVTMGITLLSNSREVQDQQDAQQVELNVKSFNGQFEPAIGNSVSGSKVKDLIEKVRIQTANDADRLVTIVYKDSLSENSIRSTTRYSVQVTKRDDMGYISEITIGNRI